MNFASSTSPLLEGVQSRARALSSWQDKMAPRILLPSQIDASKITYGAPKALDNGGKIISVYHDGSPFIVQIPEMVAPYGLSKWDNDRGGVKIHLDLSFGKPDEADRAQFLAKASEVDRKFQGDALDNCVAWFKNKYTTLDVVQALYTPMVKLAKDKATGEVTDAYPPTFKAQVPQRDGKVSCEVYDRDKQRVELDSMDLKGAAVTAIVQCSGLWVAGGKFGVTWRVVQMKVNPKNTKITGFSFASDSDEE